MLATDSCVCSSNISLSLQFLLWSYLLADKPETPSTNLTPTSNSGKTKRSVVTEQFVETAIVADKSMLQHHGRKKLESYLFSLMNVVSHMGWRFIWMLVTWSSHDTSPLRHMIITWSSHDTSHYMSHDYHMIHPTTSHDHMIHPTTCHMIITWHIPHVTWSSHDTSHYMSHDHMIHPTTCHMITIHPTTYHMIITWHPTTCHMIITWHIPLHVTWSSHDPHVTSQYWHCPWKSWLCVGHLHPLHNTTRVSLIVHEMQDQKCCFDWLGYTIMVCDIIFVIYNQ